MTGELDPRAVLPLLETERLGRDYRFLDETPSTNDEAMALGERGAPHGAVVLAERQTHGRGRLGRGWISQPGESLTFSVVLRPGIAPELAPVVGLAAAVGLCDAVAPELPEGARPRIKWPNDLLVLRKKVSGLLLELSAEPGRIRHVVLGVGVNANQAHLPGEISAFATSLRIERGGAPVARARLLASLLLGLERWTDRLDASGPAAVLEAWHERAGLLGEEVVVRSPGAEVRGVALGLDDRGALRLRLADGTETTLLAGDLSPSRQARDRT